MNTQTQLNFTVHVHERTRETETILNGKRERLSKNCATLVGYWQRNNIWLSDDNSRLWLSVRNLAQRVADLRHVNNIPVEARLVDGKYKEYRLKCTCKIIGGEDVKIGCFVHDSSLFV